MSKPGIIIGVGVIHDVPSHKLMAGVPAQEKRKFKTKRNTQ